MDVATERDVGSPAWHGGEVVGGEFGSNRPLDVGPFPGDRVVSCGADVVRLLWFAAVIRVHISESGGFGRWVCTAVNRLSVAELKQAELKQPERI
jgi:hypothetical protein